MHFEVESTRCKCCWSSGVFWGLLLRNGVSMTGTHKEILELFRTGRPEEWYGCIVDCPDFPGKEDATRLVLLNTPGARYFALYAVAAGLADGVDAHLAADVALAAHELAREECVKKGREVIPPVTLSGIASVAIHALNNAGRFNEALSFAGDVATMYDDEPENGSSIRVGKIAALVGLGRAAEARDLIQEERKRGVSVDSKVELDRLEKHVTVALYRCFVSRFC